MLYDTTWMLLVYELSMNGITLANMCHFPATPLFKLGISSRWAEAASEKRIWQVLQLFVYFLWVEPDMFGWRCCYFPHVLICSGCTWVSSYESLDVKQSSKASGFHDWTVLLCHGALAFFYRFLCLVYLDGDRGGKKAIEDDLQSSPRVFYSISDFDQIGFEGSRISAVRQVTDKYADIHKTS